ncbi:response regulator transcription factor [Salmonella enterica]
MKTIKTGLVADCCYTRVALNQILESLFQHKGGVQISWLHALTTTRTQADCLDYLIVCGSPHLPYSLTTLQQRFTPPARRLIVMTEQPPTPLYAHFFAPLSPKIYYVPLRQSRAAIAQGLQRALFSTEKPAVKAVPIDTLLTGSEYQVVKALFSGTRAADFSRLMRVSEKTVSTHKRRALEKLQCSRTDLFHHTLLTAALQEGVR